MIRLRYRTQPSQRHGANTRRVRRKQCDAERQRIADAESDPSHPIHTLRRVWLHHCNRHDRRSQLIAADVARTIKSFGLELQAANDRGDQPPSRNDR